MTDGGTTSSQGRGLYEKIQYFPLTGIIYSNNKVMPALRLCLPVPNIKNAFHSYFHVTKCDHKELLST